MQTTPIRFGNVFFLRGDQSGVEKNVQAFQKASEKQGLSFSQELKSSSILNPFNLEPFEGRDVFTGQDAELHQAYLVVKSPYLKAQAAFHQKMEKALGHFLSQDITLSWYALPVALPYNTGNFLRTQLQKAWSVATNTHPPKYPAFCEVFDKATQAAHGMENAISSGGDMTKLEEKLASGALKLNKNLIELHVPV